MPRTPFAALAISLVSFLACERPSADATQRELAARALKDMLAYPQSQVTRVSAGSEAAEVALTTATAPDAVAQWYRTMLTANGWELKSDVRQPGGAVVIYAVKEARPLWVTLRPNTGGPGTTYTLVGVIPGDSAR